MTEERYYCERPRCSVHNKKTKALANSLEFFKNAEFAFGEDFTPEMFLDRLKDGVARLNSKYKGREIEVTQKVLVRDDNDEVWKADYFSHYEEDDKIAQYVCVGSYYKECIPYEGSEHLLGTDKSPE